MSDDSCVLTPDLITTMSNMGPSLLTPGSADIVDWTLVTILRIGLKVMDQTLLPALRNQGLLFVLKGPVLMLTPGKLRKPKGF